MGRCLFCGNELTGNGHFCKSSGHHILYKNMLLRKLSDNTISEEEVAWLHFFKWFPGDVTATTTVKKTRTRGAKKVVGSPVKFRKFGVELECACPRGENENIVNEIAGDGINIQNTRYTHEDVPYWKSLYDSSIRCNYGFESKEYVSPPIDTEEGIEQVGTVCKVIQDHGGVVNQSTGMHVHLDASDLTTQDIAKIVYLYGKLEAKINQILPAHRRRNSYCKSVKRFCKYVERSGFEYFDDMYKVKRVLGTRYLKVNVYAYDRHGTIEFRQLNGTLDINLVKYWLKLCTRIVEFVKDGKDVTQTNGKLAKVLDFQQDEIDFWDSVKTSLAAA